MQITPCEHLLPVTGIGEQHIDYSMPSYVRVPFSQRFILVIVAITIRCSLFLRTLTLWQSSRIVNTYFHIREEYLYLYLCYVFFLMFNYGFYPYLVSYLIQIGILIVALANFIYQLYKGKKKEPLLWLSLFRTSNRAHLQQDSRAKHMFIV